MQKEKILEKTWLYNLTEKDITDYVREVYDERTFPSDIYVESDGQTQYLTACVHKVATFGIKKFKIYINEFGIMVPNKKCGFDYVPDYELIKIIARANLDRKIDGKTYRQSAVKFLTEFYRNKTEKQLSKLKLKPVSIEKMI